MKETDALKKSFQKKKEKTPFKPDLVEAISYLLESVPSANISRGNLIWKTYTLDIDNLHFRQREGWAIPPFHLAERGLYEQAKKIAAEVPYAALAFDGEDMLYATQLASLTKNVDVDFVLAHDLLSIITYELARNEIPLAQERKAQLSARSGTDNIKRDLAMKIGIDYNPESAEGKKKKATVVDQLASRFAVLDQIITTTDEKEFMDMLREKLTNETIKQSLGVIGETIEDMAAHMIKKGPISESLNMLNIDTKSWKVKAAMGSLKPYVEEKLRNIFGNPKIAGLNLQSYRQSAPYAVGDKVIISPGGGGSEYDLGGSIKMIPPGTEGVIDLIKEKDNFYNIRFETGKYERNSWVVTNREIRRLTPKLNITADYGIESAVLDAIIDGNYNKMISTYTACMKKEMETVDSRISRLEAYISRFNTQR